MSLGEIAAHLVLSPVTVETHVSLLLKLGARDRPQLVVTASEAWWGR